MSRYRCAEDLSREWSSCGTGMEGSDWPTRTTQAVVANKVTTHHATGMPILHVEASFISAERGLRQGILSPTSLNHFSFILKLTIFICKQLKRSGAFGTVRMWELNNTHCHSCQKLHWTPCDFGTKPMSWTQLVKGWRASSWTVTLSHDTVTHWS